MPEERRVVTVLFAQATGLAELPETERVAATDELFLKLRVAVERHGGVIDKFIGDTVMAVFGAPVAHEDDPARGCRAALEMADEGGRLRAGLNSGEVLYGSVGGDRATVMGDAVNVAQRLMAAADPGTVLAAAAVERAAKRWIRFRKLEAISVKGREAKVEAFEVREPLFGHTEFREVAGITTPLVGREAEFGELVRAWEDGVGGYVLLEGEAGIGKSRLLAEFRREIRRRGGAWVAVGRCLEGVKVPLAPFGEIVRTEAGVPALETRDGSRIVVTLERQVAENVASATERENVAHLVALSLGYSVPEARVSAISPARLVPETHHAWSRWIASRGPALVCIEDLHWADEGTRNLLEALSLSLSGVLLVTTSRPVPGAPPTRARRLALGDIDAAAAGRLAAAALRAPASPELAAFLFEKSGGNPYYLEELCRFLKEERLVSGSPMRLDAAGSRFPAGLQGLLVARLDALPERDKEALKGASALGRIFWKRLLGRVLEEDAQASLEEAGRREMVFPQRESLLRDDLQYAFKHALLRDAAYSLLTKKRRATLHVRAAEDFESRVASGGRTVKALAAAQREAAGESSRAAGLWREAAEESLEEGAFAEALGHAREAARLGDRGGRVATAVALNGLARYREAIEPAEEVANAADAPAAQRARAWAAAASARKGMGAFEPALRCADASIACAPPGVAKALAHRLRSETLFRLSRLREAREAIECARAEAEQGNGRPLDQERARILASSGQIFGMLSEYDAALLAQTASLDLARRIGDRAAIAAAVNNIGNVHRWRSEFGEALASFREALEMARERGDRAGISACLGNIGVTIYDQSRGEDALSYIEQALALRIEIGDRAGYGDMLNNKGMVLRRSGDHDRALACYDEAISIARSLGERGSISNGLNNKANLLRTRGRTAEAIQSYEEALVIDRESGNLANIASRLQNLGSVRRAQGELGLARDAYLEALAIQRQIGDRGGTSTCLNNLGVVHDLLGADGDAQAVHEEALAIRRAADDRDGISSSLHNLGCLFRAQGRYEEALKLLDESLQIRREIKHRHGEMSVLTYLGMTLADIGDRDAAMKSMKASLAIAREFEDREHRALVLTEMARVAEVLGRRIDGLAWAREALDLARNLGHRTQIAESLLAIGRIETVGGSLEAAGAALDEALSLCAGRALPWECSLRAARAALDFARGRPSEAAFEAAEAVRIAEASGRAPLIAEARAANEALK